MLESIFLVSLIVFLGGLLKGFAGFGYAVLSVSLLTLVFEPSEAVVLMIIPLIIGNLALVREVEHDRLETCIENFLPFMIMVLLGSVAGILVIGVIPGRLFSVLIGIFLVLYSLGRTGLIDYHIGILKDKCFRRGRFFQAFSGGIAGFVFGSMSIGALVVGYLQSIDLDRKLFIGLLSFVLFAVSSVRIGLSWILGYYSGNDFLIMSFLSGFPGLLGVLIGSRIRKFSNGIWYTKLVLVLFAVIGLRLIIG